jgi:hypothetical protein
LRYDDIQNSPIYLPELFAGNEDGRKRPTPSPPKKIALLMQEKTRTITAKVFCKTVPGNTNYAIAATVREKFFQKPTEKSVSLFWSAVLRIRCY